MKEEIFGSLEFPTNEKIFFGDRVPVAGWAFSSTGRDLSIEIYLDNNLMDKGRWGLPRFDIFEKFSAENAYQSGFMSELKIKFSSNKTHSIKVIARSKNHEKLLGEVIVSRLDGKKEDILEDVFAQSILIGSGGKFKEAGQRFLKSFIELADLQPNHKVLEIGSGMARIAMPLTNFLKDEGEFYGLDTTTEAIDFCQRNISTRFQNFHFTVADVRNRTYRPNGKYTSSNYKFPYPDEHFDFVFAIAVFSHFLFDDVKNYLHEVARVLKNDHKCFITFFLLNENSLKRIESGLVEGKKFKFKFDGFMSVNEKIPETTVSHQESLIKKLYQGCGLKIEEPIRYGQWAGNKNTISGQDSIIAIKT